MTQLTQFNSNVINDLFGTLSSPAYFIRPLIKDGFDFEFKVAIHEHKHSFDIQAQIPGVKKEDIHISVDGAIVTIQAEFKKSEMKKEDERVVRSEFYFGNSSRTFQLSAEVDSEKTNANYENGILHLHLPKKLGITNKKITVT